MFLQKQVFSGWVRKPVFARTSITFYIFNQLFFKCEKGSYHDLEFYDFMKFYACVYIFLHLLVTPFRQFDKVV